MATTITDLSGFVQPREGYGLPREAYTSGEVYDLEMERIWSRGWVYACHHSQVREPGSFLRVTTGPHELIVVRGEDERIRALHNVCRHRGSLVCAEQAGRGQAAFTCPFHGWTYHLDGSLRAAPRMPEDLDTRPLGLKQAWGEVWNGFVFVSVASESPEPVASMLDGTDAATYGLENAKVAAIETVRLPANWKALWEGSLECYHCALNHPEFCRIIDTEAVTADRLENEHFAWIPGWPLKNGSRSLTSDGKFASRVLLGRPGEAPPDRVSYLSKSLPPVEMLFLPDYAEVQAFYPVSAGETELHSIFLVHEDAVEGEDYGIQELTSALMQISEEDINIQLRVQLGVNQPAYEPGPLHPDYELGNIMFVKQWLAAMTGDDAS